MLRVEESAYAKARGSENNFKELKVALEVQTDGGRERMLEGKAGLFHPFSLPLGGNLYFPQSTAR